MRHFFRVGGSATFSMERAMHGSHLVCFEQTKVFTKQDFDDTHGFLFPEK